MRKKILAVPKNLQATHVPAQAPYGKWYLVPKQMLFEHGSTQEYDCLAFNNELTGVTGETYSLTRKSFNL